MNLFTENSGSAPLVSSANSLIHDNSSEKRPHSVSNIELSTLQVHLLNTYPRPIAHMHQQVIHQRFCLIFGAGCGLDIGFPSWAELLMRLGEGLDGFQELRIANTNEAALAQSIVELFERRFETANPQFSGTGAESNQQREDVLNAEWRDHIYDALYRDVETKDEDVFFETASYYKSFADVIKHCEVTISYNFDNSIERILARSRPLSEINIRRGYTSVYEENSQIPTDNPVVFHPNGLLPHIRKHRQSRRLILTEESFGSQLKDSIEGRLNVVQTELSQKTCLIIGCSLQDPTLRHLLKKNAEHHPGHYHYYIKWTNKDANATSAVREEEDAALFEIYNLITLHLSSAEIQALGDILSFEPVVLSHLIKEKGLKTKFNFIVTGATGSNKSGVISYFRGLQCRDAWLESPLEEMGQDTEKLSQSQVDRIEKWIDRQFYLRGFLSLHDGNVGVYILRRGPLDPLTFVDSRAVSERAQKLKEAMRHRMAMLIEPSHVILLIAKPEKLQSNALAAGRQFSISTLAKQQNVLLKVYGEGSGVTVIDTSALSMVQVIRCVARVIHKEQYISTDLDARLQDFSDPQLTLL